VPPGIGHTGSFASGAGLEQEVLPTYTVPPPACTAVNDVGHIAPKGKEGENLRVHLSTSGGTFTTTTASGAAQFALRTLSSASCVAIAGGFEFSGRGAATMGARKTTATKWSSRSQPKAAKPTSVIRVGWPLVAAPDERS
jgi:hypothetical protein